MIDLLSKSHKLMEPTEEDNGYASTLSENMRCTYTESASALSIS